MRLGITFDKTVVNNDHFMIMQLFGYILYVIYYPISHVQIDLMKK